MLSDRENRSQSLQLYRQVLERGNLQLYRQVLERGKLKGDGSGIGEEDRVVPLRETHSDRGREQVDLLLSGLVVQQSGELQVYNPIYAEVFNLSWVDRQLDRLSWLDKNLASTGEQICTAFLNNLDKLSLAQIEAVGRAIALHSPEQAAAMIRGINQQPTTNNQQPTTKGKEGVNR